MRTGGKHNPDGTDHPQGSWFAIADSKQCGAKQPGRNFHFPEKYGIPSPSFHGADHEPSVQAALATKNNGGSWFAVAHNTESGTGRNPVTGVKCGGSRGDDWFAHHNRESFLERAGVKQGGSGEAWLDKALDERRKEATKCGGTWFGAGNDCSLMRQHNSKSDSRKAASALIAKIPFPLAQFVARAFKPKVPSVQNPVEGVEISE